MRRLFALTLEFTTTLNVPRPYSLLPVDVAVKANYMTYGPDGIQVGRQHGYVTDTLSMDERAAFANLITALLERLEALP